MYLRSASAAPCRLPPGSVRLPGMLLWALRWACLLLSVLMSLSCAQVEQRIAARYLVPHEGLRSMMANKSVSLLLLGAGIHCWAQLSVNGPCTSSAHLVCQTPDMTASAMSQLPISGLWTLPQA